MNEQLKIIISAEIDKLRQELKNAQSQVKDFTDKSESSFSKFGKAAGAAGKAVAVGFAAVGAAVAAGAAAVIGLAESTREYRTEQAKLTAAFKTAGSSAEQAKKTYNDLYRVLGDSGQATEAAQHLAKLTTEEKALSEWTNICQGVYAEFGSSLPIESLTEAINHTTKVGEVQGTLADALEWSGVNMDEFNEQLFWCNSESEREKLIRDTLNGIYSDSAAAYEETAGAVMDANEAQAALTDSLAALGEAVEPIATMLKVGLVGVIQELIPSFQLFAQGIQDAVNGVAGGTEKMREGISTMLETIFTKIMDIIPVIAGIIPEVITILGELIPQITGGILKALPSIISTILKAAAQVLITLGQILPEILAQIVAILPQIINSIVENIPVLLQAAISFLMAIVQAIPKIIPPLIDALPAIIKSILDMLVENLPVLQQASITFMTSIVKAIPAIIPAILQAVPQIIISLIGALIKLAPQLLKGSIETFTAIPRALLSIIPSLLKGAAQVVSNLKTMLVDKLKNLFKFEWNLPKIKLPRFSVTPKGWSIGDLLDGVIPKLGITWNARGGVFDKPTIMNYGNSLQGLGENGAEAVVPLENNLEWLNRLADMLADRMGAGTPVVLQVDGKTFARTTINTLNNHTRQTGRLGIEIV